MMVGTWSVLFIIAIPYLSTFMKVCWISERSIESHHLWFSTSSNFAPFPRRYLVMSEKIFGYHTWRGAPGIEWAEVRAMLSTLQCTGGPPQPSVPECPQWQDLRNCTSSLSFAPQGAKV
jgi:hypothetical protein